MSPTFSVRQLCAGVFVCGVAIVMLHGCGRSGGTPASAEPSPALTAPAGTAIEGWVKEWQDRLPVKATLTQDSRSQIAGIGSFGIPNMISHRVYAARVEIENQTEHPLEAGPGLYLIETSRPSPRPSDTTSLFEIAGGSFRRAPLADFAGAAVFRGSDDNENEPDHRDFGFLNVTRRSTNGTAVKRLGVTVQVETTPDSQPLPAGFGTATPGGMLSFDETLELGVMIRSEHEDRVILVSPRLMFGAPEPASFRYVLEFGRSEASPGAPDTERGLTLISASLLPMTPASLAALIQDRAVPLWKRIMVAEWSGTFGGTATTGALAAIVNAKGQENDALRASALLALGEAKYTVAFDRMLALALERSEPLEVQSAAVRALGFLGDSRATSTLLQILETNDRTDLHASASDALGRLRDESSLSRLQAVARARRAPRSEHAVRAIGQIGTARAVTALTDLFQTADNEWKMTVCAALGQIDQPEALAGLRFALQDRSSEVRRAAVDGIARRRTSERAAVLREILRSNDAALQEQAILKLADHGVSAATPEIVALLQATATPLAVREAAATGLGSLPGDEAVRALIQATSDAEPAVRRASLRSLGKLQLRSASTAIARTLSDRDPEVRTAAAQALADVGDPSAHAPLVQVALVEQDATALRAHAAALIDLDYRSLDVFAQLVARLRDRDPVLRAALVPLLTHLTGVDFDPGANASAGQLDEAIRQWTVAASSR